MSNRTAYRVVAVLIPTLVAIMLVQSYGPASDESFRGYWQLWHPYYLQLVGVLGVPIFWGYVYPLARRLGGRRTAYGGFVWHQMTGALMFFLVGPALNFVYMTCPTLTSRCEHAAGHVPAPSVLDIGFLAMFPFIALGLVRLLTGLGTTWHAMLQRYWYVPVAFALIAAVVVAPFALDLAFQSGQSSFETVVELGYVVGSIVIVSLGLFAVIQARAMGGGAFLRPVTMMCGGMLIVAIGTFTRINEIGVPQSYKVQDPSTVPYSSGFFVWMIAVMLLGAALERMLGVARPAAD